jgi:hypothetical protein
MNPNFLKYTTIKGKYLFFLKGQLSNWWRSPMIYKDHNFRDTETAFMWEKAMFFKDYETANKILESKSPREAKDLGRLVKNYNDVEWSKVRKQYMSDVNVCKYFQNEDLKELLLSTKPYILVEANPVDKIWAIGMSETDEGIENPNNWKGQNLLGQVLMEVRSMFNNL